MPQVMDLPTRRKKEMPYAPVKQKRHLQPVPKTQKTSTPKKQKENVVVPAATKTVKIAKKSVITNPVVARMIMRVGEMTTLDALMARAEIVDARGRKPKPALCLSKAEMEALTLGMHILQAAVKVKK